MLYNKDWACNRGKNYSEVVQKRLEKKVIVQGFCRCSAFCKLVIQSHDCTWAALLYSHWPNRVMGQIKPQASQTLLLWMSYFSKLTAALHGPVCCPHSTYQVIFISRMAGHTKICATTAQTNQRHKALLMRKKTQEQILNFNLSPPKVKLLLPTAKGLISQHTSVQLKGLSGLESIVSAIFPPLRAENHCIPANHSHWGGMCKE